VLVLKEAPNGLAWSADGRLLSVSTEDGAVTLFNPRDGRVLASLICPRMEVGDLVFVGDDLLVGIRGSGSTLHLLYPALGTEEFVIQGLGPSLLASQATGKTLALPALGPLATRWDIQPPLGLISIPPGQAQGLRMTASAACFDFSPDGRWLASGHDHTLLLREVATGRLADRIDGDSAEGRETSTVAFSDDGRQLVQLSTRYGLRRFSLQPDAHGGLHFGASEILDPEPGFVITDHKSGPDRLSLVDQEKGRVKLTELTRQGASVLSQWESQAAYSGAFSPRGDTLLLNCGTPGTNQTRIRLHQVSDGKVLAELPALASCDVSWAAHGQLALTSDGPEQSVLWDTTAWKPVFTFDGPLGGDMTNFALSPDGRLVVINRGPMLYLAAAPGGALLAAVEVPGTPGNAAGIRFLPDGRRFAVLWTSGRVDVFDPEAWRPTLRNLGLDW